MHECAPAARAVEALEELEVALSDVVDDEASAGIERPEGKHVVRIALLGLGEIGEQGARGACQERLVLHAECGKISHLLAGEDALFCLAGVKSAFAAAHEAYAREVGVFGQSGALGEEKLTRSELEDPLPAGVGTGLEAAPLTGGDISPDEARAVPVGEERSEVVVRLGIEVGVVEHGARGDHAGDGTAHESLRVTGILGLVADGDAVALVDKLGGVGFHGPPGHAAHGDGIVIAAVPGGEGQLEFPGRDACVLEEELVEVTHAVEEEGVRILAFDLEILPEHGSDAVAAGYVLRVRSAVRAVEERAFGIDGRAAGELAVIRGGGILFRPVRKGVFLCVVCVWHVPSRLKN